VEIRLLGPVQAWRDGTRLDLGPRKQRFVLAVLALELNRVVTVDRLVDLAWPEDPPRTARQAIRVCVSRLRAVLATDLARLVTEGHGYRLRADPLRVDAHRFRALVVRARGAPGDDARVRLLREALRLWCGPALTDVATADSAGQLTRGLSESRLVATEECLDAELRLGRHLVVLDELSDLVARHPYQQRFAAQLILAQYRAGRAADALATYRATRAVLTADLGLDPEPRLQRLEQAVLRSDPSLELPR
jgi:DNA-binding SARP family transcriptional activator